MKSYQPDFPDFPEENYDDEHCPNGGAYIITITIFFGFFLLSVGAYLLFGTL